MFYGGYGCYRCCNRYYGYGYGAFGPYGGYGYGGWGYGGGWFY